MVYYVSPTRRLSSYQEIKDFLGSRVTKSIDSNRRVTLNPDQSITLRLFSTDIVTYLSPSVIELNLNGYFTVTTKRTLRKQVRVPLMTDKDGDYFIQASCGSSPWVYYYEGIQLNRSNHTDINLMSGIQFKSGASYEDLVDVVALVARSLQLAPGVAKFNLVTTGAHLERTHLELARLFTETHAVVRLSEQKRKAFHDAIEKLGPLKPTRIPILSISYEGCSTASEAAEALAQLRDC